MIWYSSGGIRIIQPIVGMMDQTLVITQKDVSIMVPQYDSSTGEYRRSMYQKRYPQTPPIGTQQCAQIMGAIDMDSVNQYYLDYRVAPDCRIIFNTINTSAGECYIVILSNASGFSFRMYLHGIFLTLQNIVRMQIIISLSDRQVIQFPMSITL